MIGPPYDDLGGIPDDAPDTTNSYLPDKQLWPPSKVEFMTEHRTTSRKKPSKPVRNNLQEPTLIEIQINKDDVPTYWFPGVTSWLQLMISLQSIELLSALSNVLCGVCAVWSKSS